MRRCRLGQSENILAWPSRQERKEEEPRAEARVLTYYNV